MRRGLRGDDAFHLALAEALRVLTELLGQPVAHERRRRRPRAGEHADPESEDRAADDRHPVPREQLPGLPQVAEADASRDAAQAEPFLDRQEDLAEAEQADRDHDEVDPALQLDESKVEARLAA